jgi:hypothetical protein
VGAGSRRREGYSPAFGVISLKGGPDLGAELNEVKPMQSVPGMLVAALSLVLRLLKFDFASECDFGGAYRTWTEQGAAKVGYAA